LLTFKWPLMPRHTDVRSPVDISRLTGGTCQHPDIRRLFDESLIIDKYVDDASVKLLTCSTADAATTIGSIKKRVDSRRTS
jgi:hypothetical protein